MGGGKKIKNKLKKLGDRAMESLINRAWLTRSSHNTAITMRVKEQGLK